MHLYWTGLAANPALFGDHRCDFILREAADGHVFAAGHGEAGNDLGLFASTTQATKVDGGWVVTGRKVFGSLSPVWTYLGLHAMDTSDADAPKVIHGFLPRDVQLPHREDLGRHGHAGHLQRGHRLRRRLRARRAGPGRLPGRRGRCRPVPPQPAGVGLSASPTSPGAARRAYDLVVEAAKTRGSIGLTRSQAHNPEVQRGVAEMRMALEAIDGYLGRVCDDWSAGVDHGADWPLKIVAAKHFADEGVRGGRHRARPDRRRRSVQAQPHRAAVPGRAPGSHAPGQPADGARGRRQDGAERRPGRRTEVGVSAMSITYDRIMPDPWLATTITIGRAPCGRRAWPTAAGCPAGGETWAPARSR